MLKSRQIGFSTLELVRDLQYALTHPGTQTLIVGQETELANKLFLQLRNIWLSLREQGPMPSTRYDNVRELYFDGLDSSVRVVEAGGSQEAARKKGRSGTIHRLHATEVALPKHIPVQIESIQPLRAEVRVDAFAVDDG